MTGEGSGDGGLATTMVSAGTPPRSRSSPISDVAPSPSGGLLELFVATRQTTMQLVELLSVEDCQVQSMPDASPAKWHLAHTSWFFETFVLAPEFAGYQPFHPRFGFLFNSYYDALGARHERPQRGMLTRPSLEVVLDYRRHVDERIVDGLERGALSPELRGLVELGVHHEQQHQELLLTDLKHAFSINPLLPAYRSAPLSGVAVASPLAFCGVEPGWHSIGASADAFAYDNEGPQHRAWVEAFEIGNRTVTNAEFLEFVRAGGYREPRLWLSDGWAEVSARGAERPLYWHERDGEPCEFTLSGLLPLDPHAPACHLSYYEADAFASFAGARLPTEHEWEVAARRFRDGRRGQLLESERLHPGSASAPASPDSPRDFLGDVWEWTGSAYAPYPRYRRPEGALGEYNGKFMCGQMVLRGGSCATPESHVRETYRNFFPPGARWQFSGVRLARDPR